MREADMKCKVAARLLSSPLSDTLVQTASPLHSSPVAAKLTRGRKLAAEDAFRREFTSLFLFIPRFFFTNR